MGWRRFRSPNSSNSCNVLVYAVVSLIRTESEGVAMLNNMKGIFFSDRVTEFTDIFGELAQSLALDLNAEIVDDSEFDYKNELKSPTWCRKVSAKLVAQYKKDVLRKKANAIAEICSDLSVAK